MEYTYDPYGNTTGSAASTNVIKYTGREQDLEDLYYRHRYYKPSVGRFISEDPIGLAGGSNLYAYVYNNPIKYTDPKGVFAGADDAAAVALCIANPVACVAAGVSVACILNPSCRDTVQRGVQACANAMHSEADDSFDTDNPNTSNPFRGKPGDVSQSNNSKGNKSQERLYGDDGYPDFDIDYDHFHGNSGMPHGHQWDRPSDGSPPTNTNRGPGFPL